MPSGGRRQEAPASDDASSIGGRREPASDERLSWQPADGLLEPNLGEAVLSRVGPIFQPGQRPCDLNGTYVKEQRRALSGDSVVVGHGSKVHIDQVCRRKRIWARDDITA